MSTASEAQKALLTTITRQAGTSTSPSNTLRLAEAYAWVVSTNQAHGGSSAPAS